MIALADDMRAEAARVWTAERTQGLTWEEIITKDSYQVPDPTGAEEVRMGDRVIGFIIQEPTGMRVLHTSRVAFFDVDTPNPAARPAMLQHLYRFVGENPEYGFRVYRTAAGLRYLCTTHLLKPMEEETVDLMKRLHADPQYIRLCMMSRHYAARLTAKPERKLETRPSATTAYQFTVGSPLLDAECLFTLKMHDKATGAFSELPLA